MLVQIQLSTPEAGSRPDDVRAAQRLTENENGCLYGCLGCHADSKRTCTSSAIGRVPAFQAGGCGFKPRLVLQGLVIPLILVILVIGKDEASLGKGLPPLPMCGGGREVDGSGPENRRAVRLRGFKSYPPRFF